MIFPQSRRREQFERVAQILRDAGGEIVGRTKLQKTAYLLSLAGFEDAFEFEYKYYGPFSELLAEATAYAAAFDRISESERQASWGGAYSVYRAAGGEGHEEKIRFAVFPARRFFLRLHEAGVDARLQRAAAGNGAQMERIRARAEAERVPQRAAPANSYLMGKAGCGGGHGVKPPAFLGLQP